MKVGGLLLAGGRSRRFGSEKAVVRLGDGVMMDVPLGVLRGICVTVAVSARRGSGAEAYSRTLALVCLQDAPEDAEGPLAGIRRGLSWASSLEMDWLAIAPCDAPNVTVDHYRALIDAVERGAAAAVGYAAEEAEPLVSLWPVKAGQIVVDTALRHGAHPSVRQVLEDIGAVGVSLAGYDGCNVNSPADLPSCRSSS